MLSKFQIENFKNFEEKLELDLTETKHYKFNENCIVNGIVNKALIYGHNGSGKSNLGYAIFDLISHLTTKSIDRERYANYLNAQSKKEVASFYYEFIFGESTLVYTYTKTNMMELVSEKVEIDGLVYAHIDRKVSTAIEINASGAETLKRDMEDSKISIVSYIANNAILDKNDLANQTFYAFLNFVENMLFFRSLDDGNTYMGHMKGASVIDEDIIQHGNVKEFETFLNSMGISCQLDVEKLGNSSSIVFVMGDKKIPFFEIASSGTRSLALFYFWYQRMEKSGIKFVFIDEFDAFYHYELSKNIVAVLKKLGIQVLLTTHNTSLITNELLRPDCYFLIGNNKIKALSALTSKELREAHNIEKMYKANSFAI